MKHRGFHWSTLKVQPALRRFFAPLLILAALTGCKKGDQEQMEKVTTEVAVEAGKLTRTNLRRYVHAYGLVEPEPARDGKPGALARLAPAAPGIVAEVTCAEGQRVEKGAPLFRLDSRVADVAVNFAQQTYDRQKKLFAIEGASQKGLQEAEQQLAAARAQQGLLKVEAPFAGVVAKVNVQPGEAVDLASVLGELVDPNRLVATARVAAADLAGVKAGQPVEFIAGQTSLARGTVLFVSPQLDSKTSAATVRSSVPVEAALRPGQYLELRIVSEERRDVLAAPVESVVRTEGGETVISIVEGDTAVQRQVKPGVRDGNMVEVEGEGLKEGDTVVTIGAYGLPKETRVRVITKNTR